MASPDLPPYVSNGFLLPIVRGPYDNNDVEMASFLVAAEHEALVAFCDDYLNKPSGGKVRYVPLFSHMLMTYASLSGYVMDDAGKPVGLMKEHDFVFWIIALAMKKILGIWMPSHLVALPPLLFVDNPFGLAIGREVFGYPKSFGQFKVPSTIQRPEYTVSSIVFDPANPNTEGKLEWLIRVQQRRAGQTDHMWRSGREAWEGIVKLMLGAGGVKLEEQWMDEAVNLLTRLSQPQVPVVFLKQFRSVEETTKADVQQIIEDPTLVYAFKGAGLIGGSYQLSVNDVPFYPFKDRLGLILDSSGQQELSLGFWAKVAFIVQEGKIVWQLKR